MFDDDPDYSYREEQYERSRLMEFARWLQGRGLLPDPLPIEPTPTIGVVRGRSIFESLVEQFEYDL